MLKACGLKLVKTTLNLVQSLTIKVSAVQLRIS